MDSLTEIIGYSKIFNGNVHIPIDVVKRFGFEDGQKIVWGITRKGDLVFKKADSISDEYF